MVRAYHSPSLAKKGGDTVFGMFGMLFGYLTGLAFQLVVMVFRILYFLCISPGPLMSAAAGCLVALWLQSKGMPAAGAWTIGIIVGCLVALFRWRGLGALQYLADLPQNIIAFIISEPWRNKKMIGTALVIASLVIAVCIWLDQGFGEPAGEQTDVETKRVVGVVENGSGIDVREVAVPRDRNFSLELPAYVLLDRVGLISGDEAIAKHSFNKALDQEVLDMAKKFVEVKLRNLEMCNIAPQGVWGTWAQISPECLKRVNPKEPVIVELIIALPGKEVPGISGTLCKDMTVRVDGFFGHNENVLTPEISVEIIGKKYNLASDYIEADMLEGLVSDVGDDAKGFKAYLISPLLRELKVEYLEITSPVKITFTFPSGPARTAPTYPGVLTELYLARIWFGAELGTS
jgi:hypothetical protein